MLDLIGTISATAAFALLVGTVAVYLPLNLATRWLTGTVLWGAGVVILAALGGLAPGAAGGLPAPGLLFGAAMLALFGAFAFSAQFRSALLAIPMPIIVAFNIARVGGIFFLLLLSNGRLSSPFAPSAGWGDIITGVAAAPLAFLLLRTGNFRLPVAVWNAFGSLDLVVAVSLGLLSAPNTPFQVFTASPGTVALTGLPWIIIPTILVPIYFLLHFTIATKLHLANRAGGTTRPQFA